MTALAQIAAGYLAMRRSLGYQMKDQGRLLMDYLSHLEDTGQATVTVANAVSWAIRPSGTSPVWHSRRLSVVRCFARHLSAYDPSCQVPPADLLPVRNSRATPYIYSEDEICALVHAAGTLARPLHAASCQAVISLLAASGMRIGEAVKLARHDADLGAGVLTVVRGKYGASRYVPLHPSTVAMLRRHAARRDRLCPAPATDRFFVTSAGTPLSAALLEQTFTRLLVQAQITAPPGQRRPRIHDYADVWVRPISRRTSCSWG
jgi:integrase/recombinase XerD